MFAGLLVGGGGLVFDEVQTDLETQGYEVLPFLLPACAVNAPHRRDRIFFIANNVKHSNSIGQKWGVYSEQSKNANGKQPSKSNASNLQNNAWQNFPTESPLCNGNDGISERLDNITFSKWRNESIKAGGNAIVPQVAHQIFKAINQCNYAIIKST